MTHAPAGDWTCNCGYDYFGGSTAYSNQLFAAHLRDTNKGQWRDLFAHPGVAYIIAALVAFILVVSLAS